MLTILTNSKSTEPVQIAGWRVCALVGHQMALLNSVNTKLLTTLVSSFLLMQYRTKEVKCQGHGIYMSLKHGHVKHVDANVDVSQCIPRVTSLWSCITLVIDKSWSPYTCHTVNLTKVEGIITHGRIDAYCLMRWLINLLVKTPPL